MAVRGLSIKLKLPLLIGSLLVVVTLIYGWAAYQTVRRSTAVAVTARLGTVVDQLALTLKASRSSLLGSTRTVADSPAVRAYALHPEGPLRAFAEAALKPPAIPAQQIVVTELWSANAHRLLSVGAPDKWSDARSAVDLLQQAAGTDSGAVGPFRAVGDSIVYGVAVPVMSAGRLRGYVVQWRRVAASADTRQQNERLNRLIGSDAHLFIGSTPGDIWTDLSRRVPPPPVDVGRAGGVARYERAGVGPVLGAARPVPLTPWVVLVEFPKTVIAAPARQFLGRLTLIGAILLVVGLVTAWGASLTLTRPLTRLTHVTEAVAAGDYGHPTAARTMDRLIDDLLAYSRLTRSELDLAPIDLGRVLKGSLQQLDAEVRSRNARVDVAESLPAVVAHGPTLTQVLANLLANGIKFVPPGRTPEVRVRAERRDGGGPLAP